MDGIKAWAIALCAAAVGCSLLHMLAPKGGMGRLFKLIIGIDIPLPALKAEKRNTEQTNQEQ